MHEFILYSKLNACLPAVWQSIGSRHRALVGGTGHMLQPGKLNLEPMAG